jgi:uncharacterized protein (DUF885 family)
MNHRHHASTVLTDLCDRFWTFYCDEFPITAISAGAAVTHDDLLREAPADHERRAAHASAMLAELDQIDSAALDASDSATWQLLRRELLALQRLVATAGHLRPSLYPIGPDFALTGFAASVSLQTIDDARRYVARLARMPHGLRGIEETLLAGLAADLRYPALVIDRAVDQVLALSGIAARDSALFSPFARARRSDPEFEDQAATAIELIEHDIYPALRGYADLLRTRLGAHARDSLACTDSPQGPAFYRALVNEFATVDLAPDTIHEIGQDEVARIRGEMDEVAASAGFGADARAYAAHLQSDPGQFASSGDALREQIEVLHKRIDARIPEFFGHLPRSSYGVQSIPREIAEKMPPAYAQPNPADGSRAGIHWITSMPDKCPRYMHLPLALHEAWPGHLMHVALIQEQQALPAFRRFGALRYAACLEGWALYCERLGEEMGLYDGPDARYGRLEMEMWRALRLVVDTGLHWLGWSREQAIACMLAQMAMPRVTIEAEVDRYIGMPGQALAYQLGNIAFRACRARAQERLGARFRLREFHDMLLAAGPATLPVLDAVVDQWIERRAAATGNGA